MMIRLNWFAPSRDDTLERIARSLEAIEAAVSPGLSDRTPHEWAVNDYDMDDAGDDLSERSCPLPSPA